MDFDKEISSAVVSDNGSIAVGTKDGLLHIFTADDKPPSDYAGHPGTIGSVSIDPSNAVVASIGQDGHLLLIRGLTDGKLVKRMTHPTSYFPSIAMLSSDEILISTVGENGLRYIRLSDGSTHDMRGKTAIVRRVSVGKDGEQLATSTWKHVRIWARTTDEHDRVYFPRDYAGQSTTNANGTRIYSTRNVPYDDSHSLDVRSVQTGGDIKTNLASP